MWKKDSNINGSVHKFPMQKKKEQRNSYSNKSGKMLDQLILYIVRNTFRDSPDMGEMLMTGSLRHGIKLQSVSVFIILLLVQ